jgi:hypothetical protein
MCKKNAPTPRWEEEIRQLRQRINELENAFASGTKQAQVLSQSLQEAKMLAGLLEVEGPGIELTLQDSKKRPSGDSPELLPELYTIHDYDLLRVVNELRQAGAEAISINGQRIVASTAIRCTGPVGVHQRCEDGVAVCGAGDWRPEDANRRVGDARRRAGRPQERRPEDGADSPTGHCSHSCLQRFDAVSLRAPRDDGGRTDAMIAVGFCRFVCWVL